MKNNKLFLLFISFALFSFASCSSDDPEANTNPEISENFPTNSKDTVFDNAVLIAFSKNGVSITNPFEDKGISIANIGSHVVVNSTITDQEVVYVLSGNTIDGSFKIYSDFRFQLVMNGVSIINNTGPAINIQSGKKITIPVIETTFNRLVDGKTYSVTNQEDQKGTLFSEGQLIFEGKGSLLLYSRNGHAICSDDYVRIKDGNITIETAAKDGIHANDYIRIDGGSLNIKSTHSQGLECEKGYIKINGGNLIINAKDHAIEASYKGTEATITPYVEINGGNIYAFSENKDGINSKGTVTINGGVTIASGNILPEEAIDCDENIFKITGGILVGTGGGSSIPTETEALQYSVIYKSSGSRDELIHIESANGESILTYKIPRLYPEMTLLFSSPELKGNNSYTVYTGGSVSGGSNFNGLYTGATYTKGESVKTFETNSKITTVEK